MGSGFLMRAQRHVAELPEGRETGFLAILEATIAAQTGDPDVALARIEDAIRMARAIGDPELAALAIHTKGLAMIDLGRVREGVALLDEAMASIVAGEVGAYFTGIIFCSLIGACLALSDLRRASEWSDAARDWCATIPPDSMFPGICRANRAEVSRLRGAWSEAEAEADPGVRAADACRARDRRGRLRAAGRDQASAGDLAGADEAYAHAHELGENPQPGLALLRLAQGKVAGAKTGSPPRSKVRPTPARRVRLLSAQVEIALADGSPGDARAAADELDALAARTGTPAFAAVAATAGGGVALAEGATGAALGQLRAACEAWQELRLPYENARARVLYARALRAAGDEDGGALELRAALATFERLGAAPDVGATAALLGGRLGAPRRPHGPRGRGAPAGGGREDEPGHRRRAGDQRAHRGAPPAEHVRQAGRLFPLGGHRVRVRARPQLIVVRSHHPARRPGWWVRAMRPRGHGLASSP